MNYTLIAVCMSVVSMLVSILAYPLVLRYAREHNIVDNPNARKLQRVPVPVLGGVVVYLGILAGSLVMFVFIRDPLLLWGLIGMTIMLFIGVLDDIRNLSALLRFVVEILIVGSFIAITGVYIDNFHGLWGISEISPWIGIPLSIFSGAKKGYNYNNIFYIDNI